MAKMPTANILLNVTCPKCTAKPARPDLYPSHVGIGSDAACLELRKALGDSIEREAALLSRNALLEKVAEYAEHHPNCGYTFDHVTQTGELIGCTCGLSAALDAAKEGK